MSGDVDRRQFLGAAAMTVAAANLGILHSPSARSRLRCSAISLRVTL